MTVGGSAYNRAIYLLGYFFDKIAYVTVRVCTAKKLPENHAADLFPYAGLPEMIKHSINPVGVFAHVL